MRACLRCGGSLEGRDRRTKYCSDNCRKRACDDRYRSACVECETPLSVGSGWTLVAGQPRRCKPCASAHRRLEQEPRAREFERLWAEGKTLREITATLGLGYMGHTGRLLHLYREYGYDLPYRRSERARQNITNGIRKAA